MLEPMAAFFEARLQGYDEHMLENIAGAREFYPFTARCLPQTGDVRILDLGCGTGLELEYYFALNPAAKVTGIDLSEGMLRALKEKFPDREMKLVCGSYFDVLLEEGRYDAAVSVESLHHFTKEEKIALYQKLCMALKDGGFFILTDYFALSDEEEQALRQELLRIKAAEGISSEDFYHFDTPLTVGHETEALLTAGFRKVEVLKNWGATYTIKAER